MLAKPSLAVKGPEAVTCFQSDPFSDDQTSFVTPVEVIPPMTHIFSFPELSVKVRNPKSSLALHVALVVAADQTEPMEGSDNGHGSGVMVGVRVRVGVLVKVGVGVNVSVWAETNEDEERKKTKARTARTDIRLKIFAK